MRIRPLSDLHMEFMEADCVVDQTRLVCNPYGYAGHKINERFDPTKTVGFDS